jgi:DNA-binding CsgD family transcriptional regulator
VRETFEPFGISVRQLEVLRLSLAGASPAEVGASLFISEPTVRNHLHAIYERVGVSGRRELLGQFVSGLIGAPA